jgi:hypothetical protein
MESSRPRRDSSPRRAFDGILVVNKPTAWTSHDVVAKIRNFFRLTKLGHAGTLDPIATGVLVLLAGRATRLAEQLLADDKEYRFTIRFGVVTDTQDISGKVLREEAAPAGTFAPACRATRSARRVSRSCSACIHACWTTRYTTRSTTTRPRICRSKAMCISPIWASCWRSRRNAPRLLMIQYGRW